MIRIGLIGTQSTHAAEFSKLCNIPDEAGNYLFPSARVVAAWGVDDTQEHIEKTLERGNIPIQCHSLEELCSHCNAFMILQRRGGAHIPYAAQLICANLPVFIDKPVCATKEEAALLGELAAKQNCVICGGSGFVHNEELQQIKQQLAALGPVRSGRICYTADIDCPYDGIAFYLPHSLEIMLELFGECPRSLRAEKRSHGDFSLFVAYDAFTVELLLNGANTPEITVSGNETLCKTLSTREDYKRTMAHFLQVIEDHTVCHDTTRLTRHVELILAAKEALSTGREIPLYFQ